MRIDASHAPSAATPLRKAAALVALCLGAFIVLLDNTVVIVALPTIANEQQVGFSDLQWIVDSYTLAFAGLLLMFGHLGDRYGRRRVMVLGLVGVAVMSTVGALATSLPIILTARAGMGIFAAAVFPATLAIITETFDRPKARALAIAAWAAMSGFAVAVGPTAGGWLLNHFSWHSVFWINIPLVAVTLAMVAAAVRESRSPHTGRLDTAGIALSLASILTLVWAIIEAPRHGWGSPLTITALTVAGALLAGFAWWETRVQFPVLDVRLFRIRRFTWPAIALAVSYFAMFGFLFLVSQYFQAILELDPLAFGIHSLPFAVSIAIAAPTATYLAFRYGHTKVILAGLLILAAGLYWASTATVETTYAPLVLGSMIVMAVGLGTVSGPVTDSIMASVPSAEAGAGSAVNDTTRELGGAVGIALLGSILIAKYNEIVAAKLDSFGAAADAFLTPRQREILENSPSAVIEVLKRGDLPGPVQDDLVHTMKIATMEGFGQAVTIMSISVLVCAVLFALFMPWAKGHSLIDEAVTDTPGAAGPIPSSGEQVDILPRTGALTPSTVTVGPQTRRGRHVR